MRHGHGFLSWWKQERNDDIVTQYHKDEELLHHIHVNNVDCYFKFNVCVYIRGKKMLINGEQFFSRVWVVNHMFDTTVTSFRSFHIIEQNLIKKNAMQDYTYVKMEINIKFNKKNAKEKNRTYVVM